MCNVCSSWEQLPPDNDEVDNEDDNAVTDRDKDADVIADEPSCYPTSDTESRDQVPVPVSYTHLTLPTKRIV